MAAAVAVNRTNYLTILADRLAKSNMADNGVVYNRIPIWSDILRIIPTTLA